MDIERLIEIAHTAEPEKTVYIQMQGTNAIQPYQESTEQRLKNLLKCKK